MILRKNWHNDCHSYQILIVFCGKKYEFKINKYVYDTIIKHGNIFENYVYVEGIKSEKNLFNGQEIIEIRLKKTPLYDLEGRRVINREMILTLVGVDVDGCFTDIEMSENNFFLNAF